MKFPDRSTSPGASTVDPTLETVLDDGLEGMPDDEKSFHWSRLLLNIQLKVVVQAEEDNNNDKNKGILGAVIDLCGGGGGRRHHARIMTRWQAYTDRCHTIVGVRTEVVHQPFLPSAKNYKP